MTDALLDALQGRKEKIAADVEARMRRDRFIMGAFRKGFDTHRIAAVLRLHECVVANRLAYLRDLEAGAR